jgi:hypothetical protein
MRRFLLVALGAIAVLVVAVALFFHFDPLCGEETALEQASPDGRYVAAWMIRNCGATTSYVHHVNLRLRTSTLHTDFRSGTITDGEILTVPEKSGRVRFCWSGSRRLNIERPDPEPGLRQLSNWQDVEITYGKVCP